ncbi:SSI family serine proteinase inhibitor [Streptomyces sp. NPDC057438]|uniref:SSI family serine proteinase inhibitor n=1 Tax=Streptomyces sp. NPDC057438 TaxID=3346133 RepID=UPI00367E3F6B
MTYPTRAARAGLLAALALLTVAASAPGRAAAVQGDWLYVSLTRGEARSSDTRATLLLCDPPQGHGRATQACADLRRSDGNIARIPHRPAVCTHIHAPVRATAEGWWNGRQVAYEQTFANPCVMAARTGAVFALAD